MPCLPLLRTTVLERGAKERAKQESRLPPRCCCWWPATTANRRWGSCYLFVEAGSNHSNAANNSFFTHAHCEMINDADFGTEMLMCGVLNQVMEARRTARNGGAHIFTSTEMGSIVCVARLGDNCKDRNTTGLYNILLIAEASARSRMDCIGSGRCSITCSLGQGSFYALPSLPLLSSEFSPLHPSPPA